MATKQRGHGEGGVRQRPDGTWEARISDGMKPNTQGKLVRARRSVYGKTRAEVAAKLKVVLREQQQGLPTTNERLTVGEFLATYLALIEPLVRPSTYRSYEQNIRLYLLPALGRRSLAKLTPREVQAFLDGKAKETTRTGKPFSAAALQRMRAVLRQALGQAEAWDQLPRNVAKLARPPKGARRRAQILSAPQAETLLVAIRGDRLETLYRVALTLALRQGEVLGLRWECVDLAAGTLAVHEAMQRVKGAGLVIVEPKSEAGTREIKLPQFLVELLREHRQRQDAARREATRWAERDLVFCTRYGTPFDGPNVTKYFQRHLDRVGLPHLRFHDLRHAAISFLAAAGVPLEVAQRIAGHSDARLTANVYRHILPEEHDRAAEAMERRFGAGQ